jgi:hypothetical protein
MRTMDWWNAAARRDAPIGAYSSLALAIVAAASLVFRLLVDRSSAFTGRLFVASLVVVPYLVFCPALACCLYSLLFETRKRLASIGLALAFLAVLSDPLLLDSVLFLPFAFLAVLGVVKFVRWRTERNQAHLPDASG